MYLMTKDFAYEILEKQYVVLTNTPKGHCWYWFYVSLIVKVAISTANDNLLSASRFYE